MATRLCYPTDVPRGARIVAGERLLGFDDVDPFIVADVAVWRDGDGQPVVVICNDAMQSRLYSPTVKIEIDEDTIERARRLAFAKAIVNDSPGDRSFTSAGRRRAERIADLVSWRPSACEDES